MPKKPSSPTPITSHAHADTHAVTAESPNDR